MSNSKWAVLSTKVRKWISSCPAWTGLGYQDLVLLPQSSGVVKLCWHHAAEQHHGQSWGFCGACKGPWYNVEQKEQVAKRGIELWKENDTKTLKHTSTFRRAFPPSVPVMFQDWGTALCPPPPSTVYHEFLSFPAVIIKRVLGWCQIALWGWGWKVHPKP